MSNYANRLERLEGAIRPKAEKLNILRVIINPQSPGDGAVEAIARDDDGSLRQFPRLAEETKDQMYERARRLMGWES